MLMYLAAAAAPKPENPYGLMEALEQGGTIAWTVFIILVGMSVGTFYILFTKLTDPVEAHDWLHGSLARSEAAINSSLNGGLAFLATVGSTSPFIGLFGTVIGIYRALIKIGAAGQASIDAVAGPVGEALIMTALGLAVAVPAVLAYNFLQRRNKSIAEQLNGFTVDLLAYLVSNGAVKPTLAAAPAAPGAKPAAAPTKA